MKVQQVRKKVFNSKNNKKQKRKGRDESDSEEETEPELLSEEEPDDDTNVEFNFEELKENPKQHDYVLVEFQISEKNIIYYIGKVLTDMDENNDYEISFYRKSHKRADTFILPNVLDISLVARERIKMKLPEPVLHGATKRQNSYLSFGISFGNLKVH